MELASPFGLLAASTSRRLASFDGRAFVKWLLPRSFLHATLELQSETRHPQSPLATILLPKRSITPISPEVVAINRLDKAQRSIGPLPIMGRTLPITVKEPDRRG